MSDTMQKVKLGEVFELQMGKTPAREKLEYWNGEYSWAAIADLGKDKYINKTAESITQLAVKESGIKIVPENTVIMSFKLSIGKTAITSKPIYTNEAIMAFIDKKICQILPEYIYYMFSSLNWAEGSNKAVKGITLNKATLQEKNIFLHNLSEQIKIVNNLNKVTNLIEKRKKQIEKLDELVNSRFIEMFGDCETNPFHWERVTVNDVCCSVIRGPFGSALKKEFFVNKSKNTYKVYEQKHAIQKSSTIGSYYITEEKFNELKRFECRAGDIIMSCSGTMGQFYQLPKNCEKGVINQALCKFTLNSKILPIYFLTYMTKTIKNLETKGSGIQNIAAVSYVKELQINLPPIELQNKFAEFVEKVEKNKSAIKKSLSSLETLKKSLMQKYFN